MRMRKSKTCLTIVAAALVWSVVSIAPARADLTIEVLKAVAQQPPPGNPVQYPVEVHIVTTGICTLTMTAPAEITVPLHDYQVGTIDKHTPYLLFEKKYYDPHSPGASEISEVVDDKYATGPHEFYRLSGDELSIDDANMPFDAPLSTVTPDGDECPTGLADVSTHWIPSLSAVTGTPVSPVMSYFMPDPDNRKVAGRLILGRSGAIHAHVIDPTLYEFKNVSPRPNERQAIAQLVDYTFRINGRLVLRRRKFVQPGHPAVSPADFIYLTPVNNKIFVKLANTTRIFLKPGGGTSEMACPNPMEDCHFLLHYDLIANPGNEPLPRKIAFCFGVQPVNCALPPDPPQCTSPAPQLQSRPRDPLSNLLSFAASLALMEGMSGTLDQVAPSGSAAPKSVAVLSVGGLDCGPDGLP